MFSLSHHFQFFQALYHSEEFDNLSHSDPSSDSYKFKNDTEDDDGFILVEKVTGSLVADKNNELQKVCGEQILKRKY